MYHWLRNSVRCIIFTIINCYSKNVFSISSSLINLISSCFSCRQDFVIFKDEVSSFGVPQCLIQRPFLFLIFMTLSITLLQINSVCKRSNNVQLYRKILIKYATQYKKIFTGKSGLEILTSIHDLDRTFDSKFSFKHQIQKIYTASINNKKCIIQK